MLLHEKLLNLLIVDDNQGDILLLKECLELSNVPINNIIEAGSIAEIPVVLDNKTVDLVLLDLCLPDSKGICTFSYMQKKHPFIPIIILTDLSDINVALKALSLGAQDYLTKSDFNENLLSRIIPYSIERKRAEQRIIQSEASLRAIFENTSEGFVLLSKDAKVTAFNKKAAQYLVLSDAKEFCISQSIYDFVEESRKRFFEEVITKALNGESSQYDRSYELGNGKIVWIDFSVRPVIEEGEVKGICIAGRNITEKKIIAEEREFDRNNLKALINNTNDLMWSVDSKLKLITSNEAFDKAVQLMAAKSVVKRSNTPATGFAKKLLNRFRKYYERAFAGESFTEIEYFGFPYNAWSEISFYPIYSGDMAMGVACFAHDITQRKNAEKEITDYKNALDQSSIISITDKKGVIRYINDNFCKISRYPAYELIGRNHCLVNSGYHSSIFMKDLWSMISNGKIWRGEFCNKAKDGTLYWTDTTIVPFLNDKGKVFQYIEITTDITEKKLLEGEILEQRIQEQKRIARAIITAQEKERNYIGQELHDNVTQLLASSKLFLGAAANDNEELREFIKYPTELIESSINEIRLLSSRLATPLKDIDLAQLLQDLIRKLELAVTIKTDFTYSVPNSASDNRLSDDLKLNIYRIIQEQTNNIMKYSEAKNVSISIKAKDNVINVTIADDGKGFDVGKKRNGIGISNMINRVESFNGEMTIKSAPGKGCRIAIRAPY